ncbi:MAG: transcriptional regulator [Paenibacillus sp.]|jgi:DNA-binding GntR family transcriptional regulator|nr:transcriptional regulator [Paenibacillus sp.]
MLKHKSLEQDVNELRNVAQFIAESLEGAILDGTLQPGTRLVQTEIADRFGVSRLPVRDALQILQRKELVVVLPRRGMAVRSVTEKEVRELSELRMILECYAFVASAPLLNETDLEQAESLIREQEEGFEGDFLLQMEIDERFHFKLISKFDNDEVKNQIRQLWRRIKLLRAIARDVKDWNRMSVAGHKKIVAAIRVRNFEEARKELEAGMIRSRNERLERVKELNRSLQV